MKRADFIQLFPELRRFKAYLHNLLEYSRYRRFPLDELTFFLHDFSLVRHNFRGYEEKPEAYLYRSLDNAISKYHKGKKWTFVSEEDAQDTELMKDFDRKNTSESIRLFQQEIQRLKLPKNQLRLVEIMIELCEKDHFLFRDFMEEVREAASRLGVNYTYFRKLHERLRKNASGNERLEESLMSFGVYDRREKEMNEFLAFFFNLESDKFYEDDLRRDVKEILAEFNLPELFLDDVVIIIKLVLERLDYPVEILSDDYYFSKFQKEVDDLIEILNGFEQANENMYDFPMDLPVLLEACLLVLLNILNAINEEEMKRFKKIIYARI